MPHLSHVGGVAGGEAEQEWQGGLHCKHNRTTGFKRELIYGVECRTMDDKVTSDHSIVGAS